MNPANHTGYVTIVDAGNGKVLYASQAQQTAASLGTLGRMQYFVTTTATYNYITNSYLSSYPTRFLKADSLPTLFNM